MTVNIELFKGKRLANGEHPVMIRVCDGARVSRRSTGISARASHWNPRRRRVSARDPEHDRKNRIIDTALIQARLSHPAQDKITPPSKSITILDAIDAKIDACRTLNSRRGYETFRRFFLANFNPSMPLSSVNEKYTASFLEKLARIKSDSPSMRTLNARHFSAVCNFARKNGLCEYSPTIHTSYRPACDRNLDLAELQAIFLLWQSMIRKDSDMRLKDTYAISLFLLNLMLQGLAPVDLASLRVGDFREIHSRMPDGSEAYLLILSLCRRKSGRKVEIILHRDSVAPILNPFIRGKMKEDYLIDCYDDSRHKTDTQRQNRLANYLHDMTDRLNRLLADNDTLTTPRRVTYYFARHAYCNMLDWLDVPAHIIRKLIGHAPGVLERSYLRPLTPGEHALISQKLLEKLKPHLKPPVIQASESQPNN